MSVNVGFSAAGIVGRPMALNLPRGGHRPWACGRRPERVLSLAAAGAHSGSAVAEAMFALGAG